MVNSVYLPEKPEFLPFVTFPNPPEQYEQAAAYIIAMEKIKPLKDGDITEILSGEKFSDSRKGFQEKICRYIFWTIQNFEKQKSF